MNFDAEYIDGVLTLTPKGRDDWFEIRYYPKGVWSLYEIPTGGGEPQHIENCASFEMAFVSAFQKLT